MLTLPLDVLLVLVVALLHVWVLVLALMLVAGVVALQWVAGLGAGIQRGALRGRGHRGAHGGLCAAAPVPRVRRCPVLRGVRLLLLLLLLSLPFHVPV